MNGVLIVDKEKGWTSHDVVGKVRKAVGMKKVGHAGTLDPLATGVLPILLGEATKASKYLIEHDKEYIAELVLGEKRDTADAEGNCIEKQKVLPEMLDEEMVKKILHQFLGKQKQIPPMYSSIKINGKKLYEYAREGKKVEIPVREIQIYQIELKQIKKEQNKIIFQVRCSKGTYIRTLCEDIAKQLKTVGYMNDLKRTQVNQFSIQEAIKINELQKDNLQEKIISLEKVFNNKQKINLENEQYKKYLNGVPIQIQKPDDIYRIYTQNKFQGLGIIKANKLKRDIVLPE